MFDFTRCTHLIYFFFPIQILLFQVTLFSADQMREYLAIEYGYSTDAIPVSLGGTFDPIMTGKIRYQMCLSKVINHQSICSTYYTSDNQTIQRKSSNHILFYNTELYNQEKPVVPSATTSMPASSSLLALVSLRRQCESPSRKRESSPSIDYEKRQRSHESLIEEEEEPLVKDHFDE